MIEDARLHQWLPESLSESLYAHTPCRRTVKDYSSENQCPFVLQKYRVHRCCTGLELESFPTPAKIWLKMTTFNGSTIMLPS